ncbi:hypothetical protein [Naumannella cuiyingiana]|uniref:Uncharacterized protein n=1 Tax=Naumannella cuiyingiana TaxID=1347891 RepID=A0A7Z0D925_9ACTN|nr:hypothetical protein [Naumannella cuiyingiana]NYI71037.1 hypothetical protein [Naumannella cuiyingiana]
MTRPPVLTATALVVAVNDAESEPLDLALVRHTLLQAPPGPVRSALLLACAGRWAGPQRGQVELAGTEGERARVRARRLREETAVARIPGLVETEPRLTIADAVDERALFEGLSVRAGRRAFTELTERAGVGLDAGTHIGALAPAERTFVDLALGLLRPARALITDGLGDGLDDRGRAWLRDCVPPMLGPTLLLAGVTDASVAPEQAHVIHNGVAPIRQTGKER